jgi:hypothetical protein
MAGLLFLFSPEHLSHFSPELGYLLLPHLLLSPFSLEVEPEPTTSRRRRRWLAGSDAQPPEPRRVAAEAAERARKLRVEGGGGGCGRRRGEAAMGGFRWEVGTAEERRRWPALVAGAGDGVGFFFLSFPFSSLPSVLTSVILLSENRPGGRVTVS